MYARLIRRCLLVTARVDVVHSGESESVVSATGCGLVEAVFSNLLFDAGALLKDEEYPSVEKMDEMASLSLPFILALRIRSRVQSFLGHEGLAYAAALCGQLASAYATVPECLLNNYLCRHRLISKRLVDSRFARRVGGRFVDGPSLLVSLMSATDDPRSSLIVMLPESLFWAGFVQMLEILRMFLRVGGTS